MLPNLKRFYESRKFNLAPDHQSLKDPPMEFKMKILVPNETLRRFHPPIK
jgi:hypothetical protein